MYLDHLATRQTSGADEAATAVEAVGLTKRYACGLLAVDDLSFHIAPGEVYALLGANGSGKSTTVGMLATLLKPTAGRATVAGHDVVSAPAAVRRRIGVTLQEAGVDPRTTPARLLTLHGELLGLGASARRPRVDALLDAFGLAGKRDARITTLSGGNRRKLDLALALVGAPDVLFLDEPTTGLDPLSRQALWQEVRRLRDAGTTILLTTQYLDEADKLADRVGILASGRLRVEGTPEQLKRRVGGDVLVVDVEPGREADAARLLGARDEGGGRLSMTAADGGAAIPQALARLEAAGIAVRAVSLNRATLDDVFLQVADARLSTATEGVPA